MNSWRALTIGCVLLISVTGCARQLTLQEWKATIDKELPVGTRRADVERFLDAHDAPHTFIAASRYPGQEDRVAAYIKSNNRSAHPDIQLSFRFDGNQKLTSYDAQEISTGP